MATLADHERGNLQPVCQNCATSTTPLWRRDEIGSVLCNACGLFLKLHGTPRPISLKTDVIKSRNRVKTASQAQKKKVKNAARQYGLRDKGLIKWVVTFRREWDFRNAVRGWYSTATPCK